MGRSGYDVSGTAPGTPGSDATARARHRRPGGATPRATTPTGHNSMLDDPERTPRARRALTDNVQVDPMMAVDGNKGDRPGAAGPFIGQMQGFQGSVFLSAAPRNVPSGHSYATPGNMPSGVGYTTPANTTYGNTYAAPRNVPAEYNWLTSGGAGSSGNTAVSSYNHVGWNPAAIDPGLQSMYPDPEELTPRRHSTIVSDTVQMGFDPSQLPIIEEEDADVEMSDVQTGTTRRGWVRR